MTETTVELPITGMTCVGCAQSIEKSLDSRAGVLKSAVNFPSSKVSVTYNPAETDLAAITSYDS